MSDITSGGSLDDPSLATPATPTEQEKPVPCCSSSQKAVTTRKSSAVFGLGSGVTKEDAKITGSRLPTSSQVLRCMIHHLNEGLPENRTRWEAARLVLEKVRVFYEKANIPIISNRKACEKLIKLLDENAKIRAIPLKRRSTPSSLKKVKEMEEHLAQTFSLWPANVESLIKNTEDLCFLQSMKGDRFATFGSRDKLLAKKIERKEKRRQLEAERRNKMLSETSMSTAEYENSSSESDDSDECDDNADIELLPVDGDDVAGPSMSTPRSHHRTGRTGTVAFIPHDIIKRPKLVAIATRLKMTPTQQAAYTEALIEEAGGDLSKVASSYATTDKSRRTVGKSIAAACRDEWVAPKLATLHWDSKLMSSLENRNISEERLTVVVGNSVELKILGVPAYQPGTDRKSGDIIADLTVDLLSTWHCADSIVNMTFDTTASNTGHISAACVTIQKRLGRALLWSACRHHVGEVILSHVFEDLRIEVSKSPDVTLFTRFRKHFNLLQSKSTSGDGFQCVLSHFDSRAIDGTAHAFINTCRDSVLNLAQSELPIRRDDYLEFIELCVFFLNGDTVGQDVQFKQPGALHKARWMAKLLYSIKICLFEEQIKQLPTGTITTKHQVSKVRDFVHFATLVYSQWWITCNSAADAPWRDLEFFQTLIRYQIVHPDISRSAVKALRNHLWYLTEEMVPLALFSTSTPSAARRALADSLLAIKPTTGLKVPQHRFGMGFGKPVFPTTISPTTTLADLVGADSWFFFEILQLDPAFLAEDVDAWSESAAYQCSLKNLQAVNVVNDCAERGVKLSSDFLSTAKGEEHYQNVLQVVERDRKKNPCLRKRKKPSPELKVSQQIGQ